MAEVGLNYILSKFFSVAGQPYFKKNSGVYNASCNICREGKSWLKKQRLFFYPKTKTFHCFNCNKSWSAINYIIESTGLTFWEILAESKNSDFSYEIDLNKKQEKKSFQKNHTLPHDSLSLINNEQIINFYKNNQIVKDTLLYIKKRKLEEAINRPSNFYVSLTDYTHQNRLIIPFLDQNKKIIFYQSRSLKDEYPKYLSKLNAEKSIFGIDKIDSNLEYIFLFEGPIDAMFVKNGLAVGGLSLTEFQKKQLSLFPFHQKIWVLDNPKIDSTSKEHITKLLLNKEKVFKWNKEYKDFNEWAVKEDLTEISTNHILQSLY